MAAGTQDDPWILQTPPGGSEFEAWRDEAADPPALVVQVGTTQLRYRLRCIDDLHEMLEAGATGCRSATPTSRSRPSRGHGRGVGPRDGNPVGGWYGLKKGLRGRFATYVPPVLEELGLCRAGAQPLGTTGCAPSDLGRYRLRAGGGGRGRDLDDVEDARIDEPCRVVDSTPAAGR